MGGSANSAVRIGEIVAERSRIEGIWQRHDAADDKGTAKRLGDEATAADEALRHNVLTLIAAGKVDPKEAAVAVLGTESLSSRDELPGDQHVTGLSDDELREMEEAAIKEVGEVAQRHANRLPERSERKSLMLKLANLTLGLPLEAGEGSDWDSAYLKLRLYFSEEMGGFDLEKRFIEILNREPLEVRGAHCLIGILEALIASNGDTAFQDLPLTTGDTWSDPDDRVRVVREHGERAGVLTEVLAGLLSAETKAGGR